jgi:hypothetical protein
VVVGCNSTENKPEITLAEVVDGVTVEPAPPTQVNVRVPSKGVPSGFSTMSRTSVKD